MKFVGKVLQNITATAHIQVVHQHGVIPICNGIVRVTLCKVFFQIRLPVRMVRLAPWLAGPFL